MKAAVWYYNRGSHAVRSVLHSRLLTYLHHPQVIMGDAGASLTTPIRAGEVKVRDLLRDEDAAVERREGTLDYRG